jgi:uncharacterized protein
VRFFLFVVSFTLLYSLFHAYAFLRARQALSLGPGVSILLVIVMLFMLFCPIIIRLSEDAGLESAARVLANIGYTWMGLLFLFVCASLVLDFYRLTVHGIHLVVHKGLTGITLSTRMVFLAALLLSCFISAYGVYAAFDIHTEHVTLKSSKIPAGLSKIRIVQITDVHLGLIVREARLGRILDAVKKADPDILVSTGDLVDGQIDNMAVLADMLREIRPKYGKFAVTGNHEYYAGIHRSLRFTRDAGFTILRGSGTTIAEFITVAGVDDPAGRPDGDYTEISEKNLLQGYARKHFTILLKHRPVVDKDSIGLFDLQVSGHVHKGQIFPFVFAVKAFFPYVFGLYDFQHGSLMYVSRGSGTWGPPMRFLSPPEVTVIDLLPE